MKSKGIEVYKPFQRKGFVMISVKVLLAGLVAVSVCMGDITGKVTDTAGVAIPQATVQLETGGQQATTDMNGNFTIPVGASAISNQINGALSRNFSATMRNGFLFLNITENSLVSITAFSLSGKALSTVQKTMEAGVNSVALLHTGAGVNLYRIKAGSNELVLKGGSIDVASHGLIATTGLSAAKTGLAKQAKTLAVINDVISVNKVGYLNYRMQMKNSDTSGVKIKMIVCADSVTDADGNVYHAVRIGTQTWTVENLRTTHYKDGTTITKITDSVTWNNIFENNLTTPAYCYYNNATNADTIKKWGAVYNWYAVNTGKLAPAGWHVPTDSEWTVLEKYLVLHGYNYDGTIDTSVYSKIAKAIATKTDWYTIAGTGNIGNDLTKNNSSGFSALPGGYRNVSGDFNHQSYGGAWWSATAYVASYAWGRSRLYDGDNLYRYINYKSCGFSVRLLRDN